MRHSILLVLLTLTAYGVTMITGFELSKISLGRVENFVCNKCQKNNTESYPQYSYYGNAALLPIIDL